MYDNQDDLVFGDFNDIPDSDLLPENKYLMRAIKIDLQRDQHIKSGDYKGQNSTFALVHFEVVDGPYSKRRVVDNFTLLSPNPSAIEFGHRIAKQWLAACGVDVTGPFTAKKLFSAEGQQFIATVYIKKGNGGYADKNSIKKFEAASSHNQMAPQQPQQPTQQYQQPQQQYQQQQQQNPSQQFQQPANIRDQWNQ